MSRNLRFWVVREIHWFMFFRAVGTSWENKVWGLRGSHQKCIILAILEIKTDLQCKWTENTLNWLHSAVNLGCFRSVYVFSVLFKNIWKWKSIGCSLVSICFNFFWHFRHFYIQFYSNSWNISYFTIVAVWCSLENGMKTKSLRNLQMSKNRWFFAHFVHRNFFLCKCLILNPKSLRNQKCPKTGDFLHILCTGIFSCAHESKICIWHANFKKL